MQSVLASFLLLALVVVLLLLLLNMGLVCTYTHFLLTAAIAARGPPLFFWGRRRGLR